jgi:hypothetical protein
VQNRPKNPAATALGASLLFAGLRGVERGKSHGKVAPMVGLRFAARLGLALTLAIPLSMTVACGGSQKEVKSIPKPGDMPEGGEWTGVFFSPTYGHLHLVKEGGTISGKWRNTAGDKWGEMHGEVVGDIFRFEWRETKIGMVGPSATTSGRGYFKYTRPPGELVNDEIKGEWGLGNEQTGVSWSAVRQRNMKPDPNSVVPDEVEAPKGDTGGGWDEGKKKPGKATDKGGGGDEWQ